jgi:uncharacterized peroxidase-related enzyme
VDILAGMFLGEPPRSDETERAFAEDLEEEGYVHNYTRLWAWHPGLWDSFQKLRNDMTASSALTERDLALLVSAAVSQLGDSYCSLPWGTRLADASDAETAGQVLANAPAPALSEREAALVDWARAVVRDPNATTGADVERLRAVGFGDREIFEATAWVAFRLAVSTVNDALGAAPDRELADAAPEPVRAAITYGRAPAAPQ